MELLKLAEMFEKKASKSQQAIDLEKRVANGDDLTGINLGGANLGGADLGGAYLNGANLNGANLNGANLERANLNGADLYGANLREANLREANLREANLYGADLYGADLSGANLSGANLDGADLKGANLDGADLDGADLEGADLNGANLKGVISFDTIIGTPLNFDKAFNVPDVTKAIEPQKDKSEEESPRAQPLSDGIVLSGDRRDFIDLLHALSREKNLTKNFGKILESAFIDYSAAGLNDQGARKSIAETIAPDTIILTLSSALDLKRPEYKTTIEDIDGNPVNIMIKVTKNVYGARANSLLKVAALFKAKLF